MTNPPDVPEPEAPSTPTRDDGAAGNTPEESIITVDCSGFVSPITSEQDPHNIEKALELELAGEATAAEVATEQDQALAPTSPEKAPAVEAPAASEVFSPKPLAEKLEKATAAPKCDDARPSPASSSRQAKLHCPTPARSQTAVKVAAAKAVALEKGRTPRRTSPPVLQPAASRTQASPAVREPLKSPAPRSASGRCTVVTSSNQRAVSSRARSPGAAGSPSSARAPATAAKPSGGRSASTSNLEECEAEKQKGQQSNVHRPTSHSRPATAEATASPSATATTAGTSPSPTRVAVRQRLQPKSRAASEAGNRAGALAAAALRIPATGPVKEATDQPQLADSGTGDASPQPPAQEADLASTAADTAGMSSLPDSLNVATTPQAPGSPRHCKDESAATGTSRAAATAKAATAAPVLPKAAMAKKGSPTPAKVAQARTGPRATPRAAGPSSPPGQHQHPVTSMPAGGGTHSSASPRLRRATAPALISKRQVALEGSKTGEKASGSSAGAEANPAASHHQHQPQPQASPRQCSSNTKSSTAGAGRRTGHCAKATTVRHAVPKASAKAAQPGGSAPPVSAPAASETVSA